MKDDAKRRCVCHSRACEIPEIDGFAAGFSCTSYSLLNNNAAKNATAIERARNGDTEVTWIVMSHQWLVQLGFAAPYMPHAQGGNVASVSTFQGVLTSWGSALRYGRYLRTWNQSIGARTTCNLDCPPKT